MRRDVSTSTEVIILSQNKFHKGARSEKAQQTLTCLTRVTIDLHKVTSTHREALCYSCTA